MTACANRSYIMTDTATCSSLPRDFPRRLTRRALKRFGRCRGGFVAGAVVS